MTTSTVEDREPSLHQRSFWVILLSRLALNMQMRVIYPFLPAISRGLGVPLGTTSLLLTARAVANLSSPLYGVLSDRYGRRRLMLAGLGILCAGTLMVALAPYVRHSDEHVHFVLDFRSQHPGWIFLGPHPV